MDTRLRLRLRMLAAVILIALLSDCDSGRVDAAADSGRSALLENGLSRTLRHIYSSCGERDDIFWCFKVQAAKLLGRALKVQNINVLEGVTIVVKKLDNETRTGRASVSSGASAEPNLSNRDLEQLSLKSLDALLLERFGRFVRSRQLQVNVPRLLSFGQRSGQEVLGTLLAFFTQFNSETDAEGRKKKDDKKYLGPFIAAVMLKAAILKMAYHSIAIVAGKALIVGKIALIISAIIGLKKLVSSEGGEKTTYEIVKHPQVQQSHTYSSSHAGEYEGGGHEGGSYHRSMDDEMMMQDKAYNAWVPAKPPT